MRSKSNLIANGIFYASLLFLFLLLSSQKPARGALEIAPESRHAALWQRIYDRLPTVWKTRQLIVVKEASDAELNDGEESDRVGAQNDEDEEESLEGDYADPDEETHAPPTIRVLNSLEEEESGLVFAHEYGHYVWNEKLTSRRQHSYIKLWQQQKQAGRLITEYAGAEAEEGFAESFSYFLQQPEALRRQDPKSWQFLLDLSRQKR